MAFFGGAWCFLRHYSYEEIGGKMAAELTNNP